MTTKAYPVQTPESAYEQWRQPHHEGADWAAFNAGYEAGIRAAIAECSKHKCNHEGLCSAPYHIVSILKRFLEKKANFNNPPTY